MRTIPSAFFALALAVSSLAVATIPVSAVEAPVAVPAVEHGITRVDERDHERCERIRHECRERHGDHDREYRECVEREHC